MSPLLRLSKTLRMIRTPKYTKTMSSHFFSPSHSLSQHFRLPRSRFYNGGGYSGSYKKGYTSSWSQESQNTAVLYTLMGSNIAVFGYAMYVKQQAMVRLSIYPRTLDLDNSTFGK
jgi:hypothetical protein